MPAPIGTLLHARYQLQAEFEARGAPLHVQRVKARLQELAAGLSAP